MITIEKCFTYILYPLALSNRKKRVKTFGDFPFHVAVEFPCAEPVQKRKHLRIRLYGIGYSPWHPSGGTLIISADLCQINFEVILLYWESPSYLLDNQSNLRNSQTERWGSFAARSASHMSSLSKPGCPTVSLQGHVVGLAGSKFSLVIFSKSEPAGPRGWPCRLTFLYFKKK